MLSISVYQVQSNIAKIDNALENMAGGAPVPKLDAAGLGRVDIRRSAGVPTASATLWIPAFAGMTVWEAGMTG